MTEAMCGFDSRRTAASGLLEGRPDTLELGSLVAALCEETEDEFELDLRFRALVDSGRFGTVFGLASRPEALRFGN